VLSMDSEVINRDQVPLKPDSYRVRRPARQEVTSWPVPPAHGFCAAATEIVENQGRK
jgi:hypothetical protein